MWFTLGMRRRDGRRSMNCACMGDVVATWSYCGLHTPVSLKSGHDCSRGLHVSVTCIKTLGAVNAPLDYTYVPL